MRWGKTTDDGYVHGVKFLNLSDMQLAALLELLRETFARAKDPAAQEGLAS